MSPRSKENKINKLKIEHLLWRTEIAFDKREVEHKVVEKTVEEEQHRKMAHVKTFHRPPPPAMYESFYSSKIEKIGILQPAQQAVFAAPKSIVSKSKVVPAQLNYSEVFYSDKNTVLQVQKSPRENLKDMFRGDPRQTYSSMKKRSGILRDPIKEDEEEED